MSRVDLKVVSHRRAISGPGLESVVDRLEVFAQRIASLVDGSLQAVFSEAERSLAELAGGNSARILLDAAGNWRDWRQLDTAERVDEPLTPRPTEPAAATPMIADGRLMVPIRVNSILAWIEGVDTSVDLQTLALAASYVDLAIAIGERRESAGRSAGELQVLQDVAARILQSSELDEILLLVTHETKRLLASDICGVMMLEDAELIMRSCVGHFSIDTAKLRMHAGIGVAGRVLSTGRPCGVENYIESDAISQDFMPLARVEKVRSALAVPIRARNTIIGVLEVWRRRPSVYTAQDNGLLSALSGLAALAIDNARLLHSRACAAEKLAEANQELARRIKIIEDSANFQERVVQIMLGGGALKAVITETARHTHGTIFVLDRDLSVEVVRPGMVGDAGAILDGVRRCIGHLSSVPDKGFVEPLSDGFFYAQPILAGTEMLGWIVWFGSAEPTESSRLVLSHVSLAVAMHLLERRNMARARAESLQAVLWDLLEGSDETRMAALDRARELRVPLKGSVCVLVANLELVDFDTNDSGSSYIHDRVLDIVQQSELGKSALMCGIRGTQLRILCKSGESGHLRVLAGRLASELHKQIPHLSIAIGLSDDCPDMRELPSHLREASIALEVARHRRSGAVASYNESGVLGLLINLRSDAGVRRVAMEILGGLMSEPDPSRRMLLETLHTFFECDCSQAATAMSLGTHPKTVAYRLLKISKLTGLRLARHQDRLLADIGTRLYFMLGLD